MNRQLDWQKVSETEERVGYRWITHKRFRLPNGTEGDFTTVGRHKQQNAAVIALTPNGKVVVAKQYRPGPEKVLYELPGGMVDAGEVPEEAAKREFLEETGYAIEGELVFIGHGCRDAYKNEIDSYFIATDCRKTSEQKLEEAECIEVVEISVDDLISNARNGLMSDAAAVLMAYDMLKEIRDGKK